MNKLKDKRTFLKIADNQFEARFRIQLKQENMYSVMFPVKSNQFRLDSAIHQTKSMLRKHQKKAIWAIISVDKTMKDELREAKVRKLSPAELKQA